MNEDNGIYRPKVSASSDSHADQWDRGFLGVVRPDQYGRWRWPFKHMKIGQSIEVEPWLREKGRVRQLAYSYGQTLGFLFSVTTNERTGNTLIRRVGCRNYTTNGVMLWMTLAHRARNLYGLDLSTTEHIYPQTLAPGETRFHPARRRGDPGTEDWIKVKAGHDLYHFRMEPEGIRYRRFEPMLED